MDQKRGDQRPHQGEPERKTSDERAEARADLSSELPESEQTPQFKFFDRRFWVEQQEGGEAESEEVSSDKPTYVQQLESRAEQAEKKLAEYVKAYKQEVHVEWEKARQRIEREAEKKLRSDRRKMVAELLEVVDLIDVSLDKAEKTHDVESLLSGFALIRSEFAKKLQGLGLEMVEAEGETFDPLRHEAVSVEETAEEQKDGKVVAVYLPGYLLDGELVRPAKVRVARKKPG
jgi:molecular chaperone GrpE